MSERPHADLRLVFRDDGSVDLATAGSDLDTVSGVDNLIQALQMRLLVSRGELRRLAHPRYGSRVHELIGEPLDRPNLELLRRHIRQALLSDPRVAKIKRLDLTPLRDDPHAVDVSATIEPGPQERVGRAFELGVVLDVG